ncbi:MAG: Fur family transcriptional regulator [Verrucomicrobiota bacterium]
MAAPSDIHDRIEEFLQRKGLRRTPQRKVIIDAAFQSNEHFTAEELWTRARKIDPATSRATLYRTLNLLVESGVLREIELGRDEKTYDPNFHNSPDHGHLICIDCGKVLEFEDNHIQLLQECITRRLGFQPAKSALRIEACCDQLRDKGLCENLIDARLNKKA